jgi:hypothetical protein
LEEEMFQQYVAVPTKKKYPNITLEFLPKGGVNKIEEMVAANTIPDIIFAGSDNFNTALREAQEAADKKIVEIGE